MTITMALFTKQPTAAELLATEDARATIRDIVGQAIATDPMLGDTIRRRAIDIAAQQWDDFKARLDSEVTKSAGALGERLGDAAKHAVGTLDRAASATIDARITNDVLP